jgi:hypothetical protein
VTAPHEEEWEQGEGALVGVLYRDGRLIGSFSRTDDGPSRAKLAAAAPEMARALLGRGRSGWHGGAREWHLGVCWNHLRERGSMCLTGCRDVQQALVRAGVSFP